MQKTKLLLGFIVIFTITFIGFQVFNQENISISIRSLVLPMVAILYCITRKDRQSYFFYFLIIYSISEFMGLFNFLAYDYPVVDNAMFYGGNILYILAYTFLILEILKSINLKKTFNNFPVHIIILLALDIYSVILVSEVANKSGQLSGSDYIIVIIYNISIMLLLTAALINYISRDSKKAMNLLIGALCIVFSEVIQVAYYYVSDRNILSVVYSILLVLAFTFFYIQSSMSYMKAKKYEILEKLKA